MALSCSFLQYRNITAYSTVSQKQDQRSSKILTFCNVTRNIRVISWMRNGFIRFECTKSRNKVSERKVHNTKIILTYKWLQKLVSSPRTRCQSEMRTNVQTHRFRNFSQLKAWHIRLVPALVHQHRAHGHIKCR